MIGSRGWGVENRTAYTLTLAWQGGQGQVLAVPPNGTMPVRPGPGTRGLFEGHVVGVVGAGTTYGLHVTPTEAWAAADTSPGPTPEIVASGAWVLDMAPGVSETTVGPAGAPSILHALRTPHRIIFTPTSVSGGASSPTGFACPSPAVTVSTPSLWVTAVGLLCVFLFIVCIVCACKWASLSVKKK